MKFNLLFLLLFISIASNAQRMKLLQSDNKFGFETTDKKGKKEFRVVPQYSNLWVYTKVRPGGFDLGNSYIDALHWVDSEFVEVPMNIDDPSKTRVDTITIEWKGYYPENLILAQKEGKWGIIKANGEIVRPFEFDSILFFPHSFGSENGPLLVPFKDDKLSVINQKNETTLSAETMFKYYPYKGNKQFKALEIAFFNDMLLIQNPNTFELKIETVKATGKSIDESNDINAYSYGYTYTSGIFKRGNFNVLLTKQNKLLFAQPQNQVWVQFYSKKDKKIKVNLDVCTLSSINESTVHTLSNLAPNLQIKFVNQP
jgi:hypothetical protein